MTKSQIPVVNVPARIDVLVRQIEHTIANESKASLKHGGPIGFKDKNPGREKGKLNKMALLKRFALLQRPYCQNKWLT